MTEVAMGDEKIVTDLPPEAVADLQSPKEPEKPQEPAKPAEGSKQPPVEAPKTEVPKAEAPKEPAKELEVQEPSPKAVERLPKKASPFQTLLEKKHEAEKRAEAAEAKLKELSEQPKGVATTADIKAFAEKYELKEEFVAELLAAVRAGLKPELPKEVQDLIAKQQLAEQEQAEQEAFKADYARLSATLSDELLKKPEVREKLAVLAYSTEKAPDGEPYFKKPLFELYMKYVKPEVEPGKVTVDESRGGSRAGGDVLDFEAIHDDDAKLDEFATKATSEQWQAYTKWRDTKQGDVPIRHAKSI